MLITANSLRQCFITGNKVVISEIVNVQILIFNFSPLLGYVELSCKWNTLTAVVVVSVGYHLDHGSVTLKAASAQFSHLSFPRQTAEELTSTRGIYFRKKLLVYMFMPWHWYSVNDHRKNFMIIHNESDLCRPEISIHSQTLYQVR